MVRRTPSRRGFSEGFDQVDELDDGVGGPGGEAGDLSGSEHGGPEADAFADGVGLHEFDAASPIPRVGTLTMRVQADFIGGIGKDAEVGQDVLDFLAVVEFDAAGDLIGNLLRRRASSMTRERAFMR